MKLYNKIGVFALAVATLSSCAKHDPFADNMELGQVLPTVSWELGSSTCKAGEEAGFTGKYYFDGTDNQKVNIDHSEVWAMVTKSESAAATLKLVNSYAYTKTEVLNDTVRSSQLIKRYEHKNLEWNAAGTIADFNKVYAEDGQWEDAEGKYNSEYHIDRTNGYEYILTAKIPTSQTLAPVSWMLPGTWDQAKFESYYPANFQADFNAKVVEDLTKDSTFYNALRDVYINYDFTAEQITRLSAENGVEFPTVVLPEEKDMTWTLYHSEEWMDGNNQAHPATPVVGKYYFTVVDGITYVHEISLEEAKDEKYKDVNLYDVYESSPWLFSRYNDDLGKVITTVRAQYMPFFKAMISEIPFEAWIYDSTEHGYSVAFGREYKLIPVFKVVGTNNKVGYSTDDKEISLN